MTRVFFQSLGDNSFEQTPSQWCTNAERLIAEGEPVGLVESLQTLGVPVEGLIQTPVSAAVAIRGYMDGRRFVHHERRGYLPMPSSMLPDQRVSSLENGVPQWVDGLRRSPKYFSFGLDAVFPPYDPNYRSKWLAHELLHMLCGFHWSSELTPFELYLSARISELLPVVHWYGLDEIYRPRCKVHHGQLLYRRHCQACESTFDAYWKTPLSPEMRTAALKHAAHAISHYESEIQACALELQTGKLHPNMRPGLDSSSDARGYLRGHYNRLTSWSFGAWMDLFMIPDLDYHSSIANQLTSTQNLFLSLFSEAIPMDAVLANRRFSRRRLQDFGARALMALEWLDDDALALTILNKLENVAVLSADLIESDRSSSMLDEAISAVVDLFHHHANSFPDSTIDHLLQFGLPNDGSGIKSIALGLKQALPETLSDEMLTEEHIAHFMGSVHFIAPYSLRKRYDMWQSSLPLLCNRTLSLEAWLLDGPFLDSEAEEFGVIPQEGRLPSGVLRQNETVRIATFDPKPIEELFGWTDLDGPTTLIRVYYRGELRIRPVPNDCLLSNSNLQELAVLEDLHLALIEEGYLVFLPSPL